MSATTLAERGKKALEVSNYTEAITHYSDAIKQAPTSPDYFIQRSTAYLRLQKYNEALADAEVAVLNATQRAKRELITEAQFRRGQALWQLGRYADAKFIIDLVLKRHKDHKSAGMWRQKCEMKLNDPNLGGKECTVTETPTATTVAPSEPVDSDSESDNTATAPPPAPTQTPRDKIRYEWYQNSSNVYITLLAKGVPKDTVQVNVKNTSVTINFPLDGDERPYHLDLAPLFSSVDPEKAITRVLPSKIEITLHKSIPGQKWANLQASAENITPENASKQDSTRPDTHARFEIPAPSTAPAYPTSSKKGPKNWDDIGKAEEKEEEDESGDPNSFFKKLFKGANPEMQRAMMKSYTESNGTSLSTNWEEVSKGKVETVPPTGMDAKPYNQ